VEGGGSGSGHKRNASKKSAVALLGGREDSVKADAGGIRETGTRKVSHSKVSP